jgi:hypothetical protein
LPPAPPSSGARLVGDSGEVADHETSG